MTEAASIVGALKGDWYGHYGLVPCPVCQPERRRDQRALSLSHRDWRLLAYCHKSGCEFADIVQALDLPDDPMRASRHSSWTERAQTRSDQDNKDKARRIWRSSEPIAGTKGKSYFRSRGIALDLPKSLRWCPDILHGPSHRRLSAIVADVRPSGGVHRTYLEKDGPRLGTSAKLMLGPCAGGTVRLADGPGALLVGEGIESTLSIVQLLDQPDLGAWAALSTSGMKALQLLSPPRELIVAPDGDAAGRDAAHALAERATSAGWRVSIVDPGGGMDWNDVLLAREVTP